MLISQAEYAIARQKEYMKKRMSEIYRMNNIVMKLNTSKPKTWEGCKIHSYEYKIDTTLNITFVVREEVKSIGKEFANILARYCEVAEMDESYLNAKVEDGYVLATTNWSFDNTKIVDTSLVVVFSNAPACRPIERETIQKTIEYVCG